MLVPKTMFPASTSRRSVSEDLSKSGDNVSAHFHGVFITSRVIEVYLLEVLVLMAMLCYPICESLRGVVHGLSEKDELQKRA